METYVWHSLYKSILYHFHSRALLIKLHSQSWLLILPRFSLFSLSSLFSLLFLASSSEENIPLTITIPLTSTFTSNPSADPIVFVQELASASMARAHRLKYGKPSPLVETSLFPQSYGGHTVPLSFGTP